MSEANCNMDAEMYYRVIGTCGGIGAEEQGWGVAFNSLSEARAHAEACRLMTYGIITMPSDGSKGRLVHCVKGSERRCPKCLRASPKQYGIFTGGKWLDHVFWDVETALAVAKNEGITDCGVYGILHGCIAFRDARVYAEIENGEVTYVSK